jgi:hypothetical protein
MKGTFASLSATEADRVTVTRLRSRERFDDSLTSSLQMFGTSISETGCRACRRYSQNRPRRLFQIPNEKLSARTVLSAPSGFSLLLSHQCLCSHNIEVEHSHGLA